MADTELPPTAGGNGLPIAPSLDIVLEAAQVPVERVLVDARLLKIAGLAMAIGVVAAFVAQLLVGLIGLVTNLAFYGRLSVDLVSPAENQLGPFVVLVPVLGGLIVGVIARYGSKAIRGHGIPEAMEQILVNQSRIPARITFLKPISAAISIGTGGPFGAEGPIIATGGALGSVVGQIVSTTAAERKTLLAAGAAAGMAATFGSPVSAVLLAVELLLFEFRPRSMIPVALASAAAAGIRAVLDGVEPIFAMPNLEQPTLAALAVYILCGAAVGLVAVGVTRAVYAVEDAFERLPIHWMWWPALGAVAVGVVGYFAPRTLGVGYNNITDIISNRLPLQVVIWLCSLKFVSWTISLGSGTSGGTLAPLFTIGGGLGAVFGAAAMSLLPGAGIDLRIAALVGMASIFAGASRALLASVVFAFETTLQPLGLLPLLGGCTAAFTVSCFLMRHTIMTEKIARRGIRTPEEYVADVLDQVSVRDVATKQVIALEAEESLESIRAWLATGVPGTSHQGFPVLNRQGVLVGVLTRRDLLNPTVPGIKHISDLLVRTVKYIYEDATVRQAADHLVNHGIGRLPVVSRAAPHRLMGIITRSDILSVYRRQIIESRRDQPNIELPLSGFRRRQASNAGAAEESPTPEMDVPNR
jgi:H+/Cl- antiporter ClcA/predicted transcriptional regulator